MNKNFSIKRAFSFGWENTKDHFGFIFLLMVVIFVIQSIINIFQQATHEVSQGVTIVFLVVSFILWIIQIIMDIGFHKIFLLLHDGQDVRIEDLFLQYRLFWKYLGTSIILALIIILGLALLIVPGIYWGLKYSFALLVVVDKGVTPLEAFRESAKITDGVKWHLLGLVILVALLNLLGLLLFGIGLLVTVPVTAFAFVFVYRRLGHETSGEMVTTENAVQSQGYLGQ